MATTMREMLECGVHFGHQTRYWNPKMAPYIFGHRNKIHIINLEKTLALYQDALKFVRQVDRQQGRDPVCRHQAPGARNHQGRGAALRLALRRSSLAGRHADQLQDGQAVDQAPEGHGGDDAGRLAREADQERSAELSARNGQAGAQPGRHQGHERAAGCAVRDRRRLPQGRGHRSARSSAFRSSPWWIPITIRKASIT